MSETARKLGEGAGAELAEAIGETAARERVVMVRGEKLTVRPMKVRQLALFMPAIAPVLEAVNLGTERLQRMEAAEIIRLFNARTVLELITQHHAPLLAAAAAAVDKDAAWLGEAEVDELCELVTAVTMVNLDFFVRRLVPMASKSLHGLADVLIGLPGAGRTRSKS